MEKKTFYCSPPTLGAEQLFEKVVHNTGDADYIVLCGGSDICPAYYKKSDDFSHYNHARDRREWMLLNRYALKKKWIGICRGMQMLGIYFGQAQLYSDVPDHIGGTHKILDPMGEVIGRVNSHHHQAIIETTFRQNVSRLIPIAYSDDGLLEIALILTNGKPRALCFQSHPEFDGGMSTELFYGALDLFNRDIVAPHQYINNLKRIAAS